MTKIKYYKQIAEYVEIAKSRDNGIMFYEQGELDDASIKLCVVLEKMIVRVDAKIVQLSHAGASRRYNELCCIKHKLNYLIEKVRNRETITEEEYEGTYVSASYWTITPFSI